MRFPLHPVLALKTARALFRLVRHLDLDSVNALIPSLVSEEVIRPFADHLKTTEQGRRAIADRYRWRPTAAEWNELERLPRGTFGRALHDGVLGKNLDPEALVRRPDAEEWQYVDAHLLEVHDVWHVATGFDTTPEGELGLLAFYSAQFPAPFAIMLMGAVHANTSFFAMDRHAGRMNALVAGWLLGRRSAPLFGVRWEAYYAMDLDTVRARIGCPVGEVSEWLAREASGQRSYAAGATSGRFTSHRAES